jgi:hypothetical protein
MKFVSAMKPIPGRELVHSPSGNIPAHGPWPLLKPIPAPKFCMYLDLHKTKKYMYTKNIILEGKMAICRLYRLITGSNKFGAESDQWPERRN